MSRENIYPAGPYQTPLIGVDPAARGRSLYWDLPSYANIEQSPVGRIGSLLVSLATSSVSQFFNISDGRQISIKNASGTAATTYRFNLSAYLNNVQVMESQSVTVEVNAAGVATLPRIIYTVTFDQIEIVGALTPDAALLIAVTYATSDARIDDLTRS